jgi:ribosome biogenesis GTPase YqeH
MDPQRAGYVPAKVLDKLESETTARAGEDTMLRSTAGDQLEQVVCRRCFRLNHYNEVQQAPVDQDEFLQLLGSIGNQDALVLHIVDLFDFEGSLISGLQRFVGNNEIVLVANKLDLLPKSLNPNRLRNWVQKQCKAQGLKVCDVVLCSAKRGAGMERVAAVLDEHRGGRDVYVVGATNVGKSQLINRLITDYSDLQQELTVSRYPGTTLGAVRIPLADGQAVIDTPGIVYTHRLTELVPSTVLADVLPEKEIKPQGYQLNSGQTLFIGALARFDFIEGEHQPFTFYVSGRMKLHRTKRERADELYEVHRGELLAPPTREELSDIPPFSRHRIRVPRGIEQDIFISGLGWIRVNKTYGALVDVYAPRGVRVMLREALV